jgi:hypothetical protein
VVEVFAEASAPNIARGRGRVCSKNPLVRFTKYPISVTEMIGYQWRESAV